MAEVFAKYDPFVLEDDDGIDSEAEADPNSDDEPFSDSDDTDSESSDGVPSTPPESDDPDKDADFKPSYRERKRLGMPVARRGESDIERFRTHLLRQHRSRAHDLAFTSSSDAPLSLRRWITWRRNFLKSYAITKYAILEEVIISRVRGVSAAAGAGGAAPPADASAAPRAALERRKLTVYRALFAILRNPMLLIQTVFARLTGLAALTPVALCADGIAEVASKCPGRGKIFGMYFKPMALTHPQSPHWLIPFLLSFASDSSGILRRVFATIGITKIIEAIQRRRYGDPEGVMTSLVLCFLGDYPACCATILMQTPARQFPSTAGYVPLWLSPLCWHCGAGGGEIYNRESAARWRANRPAQMSRLREMKSSIGIPLRHVFYDPVHGICVVFQSVLCDMAIYFQKLHSDHLHPVAAFIYGLFGSDLWDPFLVRAESRSDKRRSKKPYYANDPADVFFLLFDPIRIKSLLALLTRHQIQWHLGHLPPDQRSGSPLELMLSVLQWVDAYACGHAKGCERHSARAEDLWLHMNSLFASVPADQACALDPPPTFVPQITAYGPASHTSFCSSSRYISFVDRTMPNWRDECPSFLKVASSVFLEHGMRQIRLDYTDFGIGGRVRQSQPYHLLMRQVELCLLRSVVGYGAADQSEYDEKVRARDGNSAYNGIPLSKRIDPKLLAWKS